MHIKLTIININVFLLKEFTIIIASFLKYSTLFFSLFNSDFILPFELDIQLIRKPTNTPIRLA